MISLTGKALAYLDQQSKATLLSITFGSVVSLGFIDYLTGFEMSFALFYLFPVLLAAWYLGRNMAVVVSLASAVTWHITNQALNRRAFFDAAATELLRMRLINVADQLMLSLKREGKNAVRYSVYSE